LVDTWPIRTDHDLPADVDDGHTLLSGTPHHISRRGGIFGYICFLESHPFFMEVALGGVAIGACQRRENDDQWLCLYCFCHAFLLSLTAVGCQSLESTGLNAESKKVTTKS
jgi:hypothetical protein